MTKLNRYLLMTILLVLGFVQPISGGPTIIEDNRVTTLGTTPVLGRGYSVATNTFQSTCLQNVELTQPSYDFTYSFQEMDEFLSETSAYDSQFMQVANTTFKNYLNEAEQKTTTQQTGTGNESITRNTKEIIVNVKIDSYYASVDESITKLSESAASLVTSNDLPGFFSSCGAYYVRSIRRSAQFISVFKFESVSTAADGQFIYQLESELKGFGKKVVEQDGDDETEETVETTDTTTETGSRTQSFIQEAVSRNLTITASAFGLGKNETATLISYDIETFKNAIKDAFISMQNPRTGKVTSIEVVPWVENTEFQTLMKLDQPVEKIKIDEQKGTAEVDGDRKLTMYEKKYNLNQNAEFLSELERADRSMLNIYYKAKICRKHIDTNWKQISGGQRVFKTQFAKRYVMNNRQTNVGVELTQLDAALSRERIRGLLNSHRSFMYGGGQWGDGAAACIGQLMEFGIYKVSFRSIKSCATLEENLAQIEDEIIQNHCLPILFKPGYVPGNAVSNQQ